MRILCSCSWCSRCSKTVALEHFRIEEPSMIGSSACVEGVEIYFFFGAFLYCDWSLILLFTNPFSLQGWTCCVQTRGILRPRIKGGGVSFGRDIGGR